MFPSKSVIFHQTLRCQFLILSSPSKVCHPPLKSVIFPSKFVISKLVWSYLFLHLRLYVVRNPLKREEACKPTVLADGRTVYRCTYCNKDFATYSDINRHMDFHEGTLGRYQGNFLLFLCVMYAINVLMNALGEIYIYIFFF